MVFWKSPGFFPNENQGLPDKKIPPSGDPPALGRQRQHQQAIQPRAYRTHAALWSLSGERLPEPEFRQRDREQQGIGIGAAQQPDSMFRRQRNQPPAREALP